MSHLSKWTIEGLKNKQAKKQNHAGRNRPNYLTEKNAFPGKKNRFIILLLT